MINDFNNEYILNTPNIIHISKHQKVPQNLEAYNINISLVGFFLGGGMSMHKSVKKQKRPRLDLNNS